MSAVLGGTVSRVISSNRARLIGLALAADLMKECDIAVMKARLSGKQEDLKWALEFESRKQFESKQVTDKWETIAHKLDRRSEKDEYIATWHYLFHR